MIGKNISHYKILEKLGEGGMGIVYKAQDTKLNRHVALKFLHPGAISNRTKKTRLLQEAQAAAAVNHPNISTVYEINEFEEQVFIAMEYIEGRNLKEIIHPPLSPLIKGVFKGVLDIATQIAEGLQDIHNKGIVHRDIKSDNIRITDKGRVKIMDLGLVKSLQIKDKLSEKDSTSGTIAYMSPEQLRGEEVDNRSDIWSWGVVLYEMLTGRLPFKTDKRGMAVVYSILDEQPEPLQHVNADIPKKLEDIVSKALAKDPGKRYQSMQEVIKELGKIQKEMVTKEKQTTDYTMLRRLLQKPVKTLVPLFILIAVITGVLIYLLNQAEKKSKKTGSQKEYQDEWTKSIAVLPFVDMSIKKDQEYFCDGIAEELINTLSQIGELRVAARTSAFSFKGTSTDIREIGKKLNVEYIVEGSVRKSGEQLRITAQLIDVSNGYHLWSDKYDRQMEDLFKIQDEISHSIVNAMKIKILVGKSFESGSRHTQNMEAYHLYLRGRHFWNRRTEEGLVKSISLFQEAIDIDPNYALAYSGLADAYSMLPFYSSYSYDELIPKAKKAAIKAMELNGDLAEVNTSLAFVKGSFEWDWDEAEKLYKKAIELNPGYATAHHWYGEQLRLRGRFNEGLAEMKKAYELDPLAMIINRNLGRAFNYNGQYKQAETVLKRAFHLDSTFNALHEELGLAYLCQSMYSEAITEFKKEYAITRGSFHLIGVAYARMGNIEKAQQVLNELNKQNPRACHFHMYFVLGQMDKGFHCLEELYDKHDISLSYSMSELMAFPIWNNLHSDPRFIAIQKKMGLKPVQVRK